ncbi:MAG: type I restriction enzyme HsdR N-terminal domain-containing protein [Simkaniaceae bacterium]|nr:type I restriction enzyme HsdR N-terminal domain-containing protein [Simkaniaceae bacterium]
MARLIYDGVRKNFVRATPEEIVRQTLVQIMVSDLGFPSSYIAVEKKLSELPHLSMEKRLIPRRRFDIICFAKNEQAKIPFFPLLLVECKATNLNAKAFDQVIGYNSFIRARFVALVNEKERHLGWFDHTKKKYQFTPHLPSYQKLLESLE